MPFRARVAIVRTQPDTVLEDTVRLCELGGMRQVLDPSVTTILKDNISWHFPHANRESYLGNSRVSSSHYS